MQLARQMTLADFRLMALVPPSELSGKNFLHAESSPHATELTQNFTRVRSLYESLFYLIDMPSPHSCGTGVHVGRLGDLPRVER